MAALRAGGRSAASSMRSAAATQRHRSVARVPSTAGSLALASPIDSPSTPTRLALLGAHGPARAADDGRAAADPARPPVAAHAQAVRPVARPRVRRARTLAALPACLAEPLSPSLFSGVLLAWHLPALYDLTLRNGRARLEHALFFGDGAPLLGASRAAARRPRLQRRRSASPTDRRAARELAAGGRARVCVRSGLRAYASLASRPGGFSALADQQIAAGIMWVPASIPLTIAIFVAAYRWLDPSRAHGGGATYDRGRPDARFVPDRLAPHALAPVALLIGVGIWWSVMVRRRDEL